MRTLQWLTAAVLTCAVCAAAGAQSLDGKKIHLTADKVMSVNVPISLPCDAKLGDDQIVKVVEAKTGKEFPATLRDGVLTFISEGAMPNTEHDYTVKVIKKFDGYAPQVVIKKRENENILDVVIDDVLFTSYYFDKSFKKPFLWPVNSEGKYTLTRDWPMGAKNKTGDHPHQKSMWSAFGDVNGADCWMEEDGCGFQEPGEPTYGSGDAYGFIAATNLWTDKEHKPQVKESREYRFYATPEKGRLMDVSVTFSAEYGDVKFGDTKEGGIVSVRMRDEMTGKGAIITDSFGDVGEKTMWGKPTPWCDYSADVPDVGWRGIAMFDNPKNLRYPTSWHVRQYGLFGANCFGWSYFAKEEYNKTAFPAPKGDYLLKSGEKLPFNYRVYIHSGDVTKSAVADRFADWATPPKADWAK
jgi:hypothetical protein